MPSRKQIAPSEPGAQHVMEQKPLTPIAPGLFWTKDRAEYLAHPELIEQKMGHVAGQESGLSGRQRRRTSQQRVRRQHAFISQVVVGRWHGKKVGRLARLAAHHLYIGRDVAEKESAAHRVVFLKPGVYGFRQRWQRQYLSGDGQMLDGGWQGFAPPQVVVAPGWYNTPADRSSEGACQGVGNPG
jgi:hypothetical protein